LNFLKIENNWIVIEKITRIRDVVVDNSIEKVVVYLDDGSKISSSELSAIKIIQMINKRNLTQ